MNDGDRTIEQRLQDALEHEAARVDPGDRREEVLHRAHEAEAAPAFPRWLLAAAAAAAIAVGGSIVWASQDPPQPTPAPATQSTAPPPASGTSEGTPPEETTQGSTSPSTESTDPSSPSGSEDQTGAPVESAALPVYYVGQVQGNDTLALYREFIRQEVDTDSAQAVAAAALDLAMRPGATAPSADYLQPWSGVSVVDVAVAAELITVTLSGAGDAAVGREQEQLAVQQLVWTAQAAVGRGDVPVTFEVADGSTLLFGSLPASARYDRPPKAQWYLELAPLWITDPARGEHFDPGEPVVLRGEASVFEGVVSWELERGGEVIDSGSTQGGAGPSRGTYEVEFGALPAGDYVVRVWEESAKDGSRLATVEVPFSVG